MPHIFSYLRSSCSNHCIKNHRNWQDGVPQPGKEFWRLLWLLWHTVIIWISCEKHSLSSYCAVRDMKLAHQPVVGVPLWVPAPRQGRVPQAKLFLYMLYAVSQPSSTIFVSFIDHSQMSPTLLHPTGWTGVTVVGDIKNLSSVCICSDELYVCVKTRARIKDHGWNSKPRLCCRPRVCLYCFWQLRVLCSLTLSCSSVFYWDVMVMWALGDWAWSPRL